ncbi:hypothetical protein CRG98_028536, partial [Punica granatum]
MSFLLRNAPVEQLIKDYGPLLELVPKIVGSFASLSSEDGSSSVLDNVLNLMLKILSGLNNSGNLPALTSCPQKWAPVFQLQNLRLLDNLIESNTEELLMAEDDNFRGFSRNTWQSLIGGALNSYNKLHCGSLGLEDANKFIQLAKRHYSCRHVLLASSDCLDSISGVDSYNSRTCKGKRWKGVLKEWLNLIKSVRNPKSFYRSQFLKDVLQIRLLDENDAEIQMKVLDCLLLWKDDFLLPYEQNLKNLICSKNLREELTTWSLSCESSLIEAGHRAYIVPLAVRILAPKVRKLKTLASRKHASVHHRRAVLSFLAELDTTELPLFFKLLIKPLRVISLEPNEGSNWCQSPGSISLDDSVTMEFLKYFTTDNIVALSWKKISGFLHVVEDVLGTFDEFHLGPFLNLLMGIVVRILGCCTFCLDGAKGIYSSSEDMSASVKQTMDDAGEAGTHTLMRASAKQLKDVRSFCLKIVYAVLNKYEDHDFDCEFWDLFFTSVKPLINNFKQEGSSSEKPSSLFSSFLAMSRSHRLVSLLYRAQNLVPDIFSILTVSTVSEAVVSGVLKFIENLLNLENDFGEEDNS